MLHLHLLDILHYNPQFSWNPGSLVGYGSDVCKILDQNQFGSKFFFLGGGFWTNILVGSCKSLDPYSGNFVGFGPLFYIKAWIQIYVFLSV